MSRNIFATALVLLLATGAAAGQEAKKPAKAAPAKLVTVERKREVIQLSNKPAIDVAQAINELLRGERSAGAIPAGDVVIVPDPIGNNLVVSASPQVVGEIVGLVKELDARPAMVTIRVLMAEVLSEGKAPGDVLLDDLSAFVEDDSEDGEPILAASHGAAVAMVKKLAGQKGVKILARSQVTALDNQSAYVQVGQRVPRVVSTRGDKPASIELENVGLILGVTPRMSPDGRVTMEIDFEKSELRDSTDGPLAASIDCIRAQTTVSAPDGQTLLIGGLIVENEKERRELLMVVTPHVIPVD